MSFLFFLIIITGLFLAAFPTIFKIIFQYLLGFSKANIKLKHPFKLVRTILQLKQPIWAIQTITIYIPEITIRIDIRRFKVCIIFNQPRIMLTRSRNQLLPLKIVDGLKQNNLLYNLVTIIQSIKKQKQNDKTNTQNKQKINKQQNKLIKGIKAILHFSFLIATQFFEIKIVNGDAAIVAPMSLSQQIIPESKDIRVQITLLECFAEYFLFIQELTINASLHQDHQINLLLSCPLLKLYTARHMEDVLVKSQNLQVSFCMPFTFTMQKSIERMKIFVTALRLTSHSTPLDFQCLSKLLNQILFSEHLFFKAPTNIRKTSQDQQIIEQQSQKKLVISIQQAEIKMSQLCQKDQDTPQAQKYLSNISLAILKFQKVRLNNDGFMVGQVNLSVKKYQRIINEWQQKQKLYSKQVLKINNLLINKEDSINRISHDDVKICCQREELALLGKLFVLINSRVIIDQYDQNVYYPFVEIVRGFVEGSKTLAETIEMVISKKQEASEYQVRMSESKTNIQHQTTLVYSPKQIQFQLDISELIHKIVLYSSQYRQVRTLAAQISHELTFKRITMDYKGTKQFQVTDFKLFYRQAESSNQLELQVADIYMIQNYSTLKDYFVGFTMFKLLLQFASDQEQADPNIKKSTKTGKKSLNFGKITLNYATELMTLRKLSVLKQTTSDGRLSSLYFSLAKCDFSVQRLYQQKKIMKYYLSHSHNVLSVNSITIKQFLTLTNSSQTPKQKYMINIKNPVLLLPEIDVSDRLMNYVKTFNKLQPTLQAFMNNTTDEKIRAKRRKYKIFMIDPDVYILKISNIVIGIQDSVFDRSMLNRIRFNREYLEKKPKYNESETINFLRQTAQKFNLLELDIEEISIDVKPLEAAGNSERTVKEWTSTIKQKYGKKQTEESETPRLIRVNNLNVEAQLLNLTIKIRDYPFDLLSISKIKGNLNYLKTKNIYEQNFHYLLSKVNIDQVLVQTGLNLLSGLGEVFKKLTKYQKSMDEYKNTDQFLHALKTKGSIELSSYKPYWHILHRSAQWHVSINKQSQIKMKLMTGLTPYSKECLNLSLGPLSLVSSPLGTKFAIDYLELTGNNLKIFQIGCQRVQIKSIYNEPEILIWIQYQIEGTNNKKSSKFKDNIVRVSQQIIRQLWKIKQLRTDWLLLYGLIQPYSKSQENVLKRQEESSYVELFKLAANMQLKNRDRELSIFSVLKQVKFVFKIDKFQLQLADHQNQVGLIVSQLNFSLASEVRAEKWKMRHFLIALQTVIGRLKVYKKKSLVLYESNHQFLRYFNKITQQDIKNRPEERQTFKQIFLVCRNFKIRVNEYVLIRDQVVYIGKKLQSDTLKIQLTTQLKKIIDSLVINIFEVNKKKVSELTKNQYFKMSATQRLRQTVVLVIRANRKRKRFCEKIKMYVHFKNIQVGFKTAKKLLLLTNGKPTFLKQNTTYRAEDLYRVDPKMLLSCQFNDVQIWVCHEPNNLWVLGKQYSPKMLTNSQRILKCSAIQLILQKHQNQVLPPFYEQIVLASSIQRYTNLHVKVSSGSIQLTRSNIQTLKQIGEILLTIVNTKQHKRKQWYTEKEKYSEMISNGREDIKNKLSWKYSDLSKLDSPTLESKIFITLDKINIGLVSIKNLEQANKQINSELISIKSAKQRQMFMNLISSDIEIKLQLFNRETIKKEFKINNLKIVNCQQTEQSNYRILFQMNHVDSLAVLIRIQECLLSVSNPKVLWTFFKNIHINFLPIKVRMTQQLYNQIYYFFFGINPETDQKQQQLSNILPDYYQSVLIDEIKLQAWYRTPSRLKRLEGVSIALDKYEMKDEFLDTKTLFDRWTNFIIKQLASQFFNVLGQKLFG